MGRGLNAFIGGAIGGFRQGGAAYGNAYKGMLSAQAEAEKRRREEERLLMERERLGLAREDNARAATEAAKPDIIKGPNGEPMVLENGTLRVLPGAPEKRPGAGRGPITRMGPNRELLQYDGEKWGPAPGAPPPTADLGDANDALRHQELEFKVGQIPMEKQQAAQNAVNAVLDWARGMSTDGQYSSREKLEAIINADPLQAQLYEKANRELKAILSGGTTSSTGKKSDSDILRDMDAREAIR